MKTLPLHRAAVVAAALLAGCSGGGNAPATPVANAVPGAPTTSAQSGTPPYGAQTTQNAAPLGADSRTYVALGVLVTMRDPKGLYQYAQDVGNPASASYRRFLSPQEIADRYGASASDYTKVAAYFRGKGLAVAGWRQRELMYVGGPRAKVEAALGSRFGSYSKNGVTFAALTAPPAALRGLPVAALVDASTYSAERRTRQFLRVHPQGAPTLINGYSPQEVAAAFDYNGAYGAGYTGSGITVGVVGTGPILAADYTAYRSIFHLQGASTVTQVNVTDAGTAGLPAGYGGPAPAGTFTAPPATTDTCTIPATGPDASCNPEDGEAQIDTEQTFGLAPNAKVLFYLGYVPSTAPANGSGMNLEGISLTPYEVQQAINDDQADVLSISYGVGELDDVGGDFNVSGGQVNFATSPGPMQFATLAAEGIAVFASSGDNGNLGCLRDGISATQSSQCVSYPAIDPNVTGVGGVNAPIGLNGQLTGPLTGWGDQTSGGFGGSGGGISAYFPLPSFQVGAKNVAGSTRNSPDASLLADLVTGVAVVQNASFSDASLFPFGGTSVAAPQMAAMWATVLQACKQHASCGTGPSAHPYRLLPAPIFYKAYASAATYAGTFYDVLFGDNSQVPCFNNCPNPAPTEVPGSQAGAGYDRVTGLGVPFGRALVRTAAGV